MERKYELKSMETLEMVRTLIEQGVDRMSIILRHSDRFYHKDARMEPFMGLTEQGKTYAFDLGKAFPADIQPVLHSSHFGRCIETAYLIDKGFSAVTNTNLMHNTTHHTLAPFYIKDIEQALGLMMDRGSTQFIRDWFDKAIDPTVMEEPGKTADILVDFMATRLKELQPGQAAVCISHDWNIFPIKEFKLGLPHEGAGDVGYLDGVIFFDKDDQTFAVTYQTDPIAI
ncbi:MAG: histidine phosphatase family protein [Desulfobacterales bacterium]|nr:histidine phosphatase family protein [Desulfobacterales bacterium]